MPENEMFKMALQGGSFALVTLLFGWLLFRGMPMLREMAIKQEETIQALYLAAKSERDKLASECRQERQEQAEECRQEREQRDERFERVIESIVRSIPK